MKAEQKTVIHKCRDCPSLISIPQALLCPRCKAAADEKRKAGSRERSRALYQKKKLKNASVPEPQPVRPQRFCATTDCKNEVEGSASYCPTCRHTRQLRHQKYYRDKAQARSADLPPEPPTSLKWLDKFKGWAGSGMSYAEYQKKGLAQ